MTQQVEHDPAAPAAAPRRTILKGAAVAGVALPFLAACGGDDEPSGSGATTPSSDSSSSAGDPTGTGGGNGGGGGSTAADAIATTEEIPEGGGIILDDPGIVITQPSEGEFQGFSNICKHAGCELTSVADGTINCNCHGSQYSIADGSPVTGPNGQPASTISALDPKPVAVDGKNISLA